MLKGRETLASPARIYDENDGAIFFLMWMLKVVSIPLPNQLVALCVCDVEIEIPKYRKSEFSLFSSCPSFCLVNSPRPFSSFLIIFKT